VAYCGRSVDGTEPRYKFPAGFAKSQVLFNLHCATASGEQTVIVVEGFFDCLGDQRSLAQTYRNDKARQNGCQSSVHQAGFHSVVALMGAALYDRQQGLLTERFRQIILMLDGDQAGSRASGIIAARLERCCAVRGIQLATSSQPDQLSEQAIQEVLVKEGGKLESRRVPANLTVSLFKLWRSPIVL